MIATCDFIYYQTRRRCGQPARWVTRQSAALRSETQHYCTAHRPPRAKRVTAWGRVTP